MRNWFRGKRGKRSEVTSDEIRDELTRDPAAVQLFMGEDTPEDVQRYLFLEAERRVLMRRRNQLDDDEVDLFAPPRRPGPDPGFRGCRND